MFLLYVSESFSESKFYQEATTASTSSPTVVQTSAHPPITPSISTSFASDPYLWVVLDPDGPRDNPVEDKHRRLVRSHRSSPYDRELKPNTKIRDDLGVRSIQSFL